MRIHQNIQQSFITKKWITVVLIVLLFCGQVPIKASFAGNFDDCDPNFGDQIFAWVQNDAARLSFELADADYDARIFNYMLMSHDDQHRRASKINSELNKIAVEMETFEESVSAMDFDVAAIRREAHSQNLLNSLLSTRADLETLKGIYFATESLPTFEEFGEQGLHHVGRSTLLAAFHEVGDSAAKSLSLKYNFYVSVKADEKGNITNAEGAVAKPGVDDAIVVALASYFGPEAGAFAGFFYGGLKTTVLGDQCQKKIWEQSKKAHDAFLLLPSKLVMPGKLYELYQSKHAATFASFSTGHAKLGSLINSLETRLKVLTSYDLQRNVVAKKVLTSEKIAALNKKFEQGGASSSIFSNTALILASDGILGFNKFLAKNQILLLQSCGNLEGFLRIENQIDALKYGSEAYELLRQQKHLAPLNKTLLNGLSSISAKKDSASSQLIKIKKKTCLQTPIPKLDYSFKNTVPSKNANLVGVGGFSAPLRNERRSPRNIVPNSVFKNTAFTGQVSVGICVLITFDGSQYSCGSSTEGNPYSDNFADGARDPKTQILLGAADGGYANDNRKVATEISSVNSNLRRRVEDLKVRAAGVKNAVSEWNNKNGEFLSKVNDESNSNLIVERNSSDAFSILNAATVDSSKIVIENFLAGPLDDAALVTFVSEMGGDDPSLQNIGSDVIPADAPPLPGITAASRVFQRANLAKRMIIRESFKSLAQIEPGSDSGRVANEMLATAGLFSEDEGNKLGQILASELVKDSASIRLFRKGLIKKVLVTSMRSDGELSRSEIDNLNSLPYDSVVERARRFKTSEAVFNARLSAVKANLNPTLSDFSQRSESVKVSEQVSRVASKSFKRGELIEGSTQLEYASTILDIATSLTPGVSLGRSVYEVISGKNLITGEPLTELEYAGAVIGIVTAGLGKNAIGGGRILHAIAETVNPNYLAAAQKYGKIVLDLASEARQLTSAKLQDTLHVAEKIIAQKNLDLTLSNVRKVIDVGQPYIDISRFEGAANNAGLVFMAKRESIGLAVRADEVVGVVVSTEKRSIVTVITYESTQSMEAVKFNNGPIKRYYQIVEP